MHILSHLQKANFFLFPPEISKNWRWMGCQITQFDFDCISFMLEVYLTTLFSNIVCFSDFFGTGCDGTGRTVKQTDIGTDRLFSENITLD